MDKVSNEEMFSAILSSQILIPYLEHEPELAVLLENPNHCNIHYRLRKTPLWGLLRADRGQASRHLCPDRRPYSRGII